MMETMDTRARPGPVDEADALGERRGVEIHAAGLRHAYAAPEGQLDVLTGVDLDVPAGGYCALQGPSGAGKTTLLALIGGLEPLQAGTLRVGGVDLAGVGGVALAAYRRSTVGFVFQDFGLLETLTARENVELAATLDRAPPTERRRRADELLAAVGLSQRSRHRPAQLSGGERQRVAMARALMNRPRLLLADEPTGNLDETSAVGVIELLEELQRRWGFTLVLVTHNRALAIRAAQRLLLKAGKVVEG
jgi:putative ABC transport system ATP-binding protein